MKYVLRTFAIIVVLIAAVSTSFAQTGSNKTAAQLNAEVNGLWPDNTTGAITPFNARQTLLDMIASTSGDILVSSVSAAPTASSLTKAFNATQSGAGTTAATCVSGSFQFSCLNLFTITSDNINAASPGNAFDGWQFTHACCGSSAQGARQVIDSILNFGGASSVSNTNRNYVAVVGQTNVNVPDAGAGGSFFGANFVVRGITASTIQAVIGQENDVQLSGTANSRLGFSAASFPGVSATTLDAAYALGAVSGTNNVGWINGLLFHDGNGRGPLDATNGCAICTDGNSHTIKTGLDLASYAITGNFLRFANGAWAGNGQMTVSSTANPQLTVQSIGANQVIANLNDTAGSQRVWLQWQDAGVTQWAFFKETTNALFLYDAVAGTLVMNAAVNNGTLSWTPANTLILNPSGAHGVAVGGAADPGSTNFAVQGTVNSVGGYKAGGTAGVSCTIVGATAHLTVVNGIVTLCN